MTEPGLPIDIRPAHFAEEAFYIGAKRGHALLDLGERWILHPSHAPRRRQQASPLVLVRGGDNFTAEGSPELLAVLPDLLERMAAGIREEI